MKNTIKTVLIVIATNLVWSVITNPFIIIPLVIIMGWFGLGYMGARMEQLRWESPKLDWGSVLFGPIAFLSEFETSLFFNLIGGEIKLQSPIKYDRNSRERRVVKVNP